MLIVRWVSILITAAHDSKSYHTSLRSLDNLMISLVRTSSTSPPSRSWWKLYGGCGHCHEAGRHHSMAPDLGDLIGLGGGLAIMDTLHNETHDLKYRASLLMRKMVRAGKLGRKTGVGFYDYRK